MNDSEQQRENKKMRAFVRTWRESRDHAFELFDVVLDVVSRVPMLKEKRLYPPSSSSKEEEEEYDVDENNDENESMMNIEKEKRGYRRRVAGSNSVHRETVAKQMEQLGVILEKMDRERDRMKQFVDEMEKVVSRRNREQTQSRKTGGSFEKSQASLLFESMERIEASWRFYGEETSACEALFGLCREAAEEAAEEKKKKKNDGGEASDGGEMVRSARAFLEVRRKVDLERRWIV